MGRSTVFVVGAGASFEFGLPIGSDLARRISKSAKSVKFDDFGRQTGGARDFGPAFAKLCLEFPSMKLAEELRVIASGVLLSPSIDNYLHAHRENAARVKLGKLLIAFSLLDAEANSKLFFDPLNIYESFDFSKVSETWLAVLFRTLMTTGNLEALAEKMNLLTFVSFNYDRIIERFFFLAIRTVFDLNHIKAIEFCEANLDIYYPYGSLGELRATEQGSGFGRIGDADQLAASSRNLRLFTEGANKNTQSIVRQKIYDSEAIFFLGFSYLKLNMDYLNPHTKSSLQVFGTTFGLSGYNAGIAEDRIASWLTNGPSVRRQFKLESSTCSEFLGAYSGFFE